MTHPEAMGVANVPRNPSRNALENLAAHLGYTVEETAELYAEIIEQASLPAPAVDGLEVVAWLREQAKSEAADWNDNWRLSSEQLISAEESKLWLAADAISTLSTQVQRLTEENEALRKALEFYRDGFAFHTNPKRAGLEWKPTEALLDDCGNVARIALSSTESQSK